MNELINKIAQDRNWNKWVAANSAQAATKDGCVSMAKSGCVSAAPKAGCVS